MIELDEATCRDPESALQREWLETNGIGGYASSTVAGANTRRYHGLLVAATKPPVGRLVMLSKLEETLVVDGESFELSTNRYPGALHPQGFSYLKRFRLAPFPIQTYEVNGVRMEKSLFLVQGANTLVVQYLLSGKPARLEIRPLIAFRDYHNLTRRNNALQPFVGMEPGLCRVKPYDSLPPLYLAHDAGEAAVSGEWYFNFEYDRERERGLDCQEDLFSPLVLRFSASGTIIASLDPLNAADAPALRGSELERRRRITGAVQQEDDFTRSLATAADQFVVDRGQGKTVIAGYHWFSDWGRDTMIALPGLTLATGRIEVAKSILAEFSRVIDRGMLPNRFPDAGEAPEYNTVDATLWYFEAIRLLLQHSGDYDFVRRDLYEGLANIMDWHERGTRFGIRVDRDGLLLAGEKGVQLTWMDAKVGDWIVTPRHGKPVEIQALWYNALRVLESLASRFADNARRDHCRELANLALRNFEPLFWNEQTGCLHDVVDGEKRDGAVRPNQVFAVSLEHSMLGPERSRRVVDTVERELLTPYGLRSLAPSDSQYRGRYEGGPRSRDGAYHQGTVWPWLLGPFVTAYLKTHGRTKASIEQVERWLRPLRGFVLNQGLGQVPEVFDGDAPHRAGGCVSQAWSVAELLRVVVEDLPGSRPVDMQVEESQPVC